MSDLALRREAPVEAIMDIVALLDHNTEDVFQTPFFMVLPQGLSRDEWKLYAKQFHNTCQSFDRLLDTLVQNVRKTSHTGLIAELEANLADERGTHSDDPRPHSELREKFFEAIGLPKSEMTKAANDNVPLLPGTQRHMTVMNEIIESDCVYKQLGAFLAQEYMAAGQGFKLLAEGVKNSFPQLAAPNNDAMKYVYGHMNCDATEHFPALLRAVDPLMADQDTFRKIYAGAEAMLNAEYDMYNSFTHDLLGMKPHDIRQRATVVGQRPDAFAKKNDSLK